MSGWFLSGSDRLVTRLALARPLFARLCEPDQRSSQPSLLPLPSTFATMLVLRRVRPTQASRLALPRLLSTAATQLPATLATPAASCSSSSTPARRLFSSSPRRPSSSGGEYPPADVERAEDEVDVCIVGGGPAGLCAAIRIKQLEQERGVEDGEEKRVIVLEKGAEIGQSHQQPS